VPLPGTIGRRALPSEGLSPREMEVLRLMAGGESNSQIARRLGLSTHTVERHVANLYRKVGARGRADATAYALRNGLPKASPARAGMWY
jgi:DNA-binding CsgD family transcriptional regulator